MADYGRYLQGLEPVCLVGDQHGRPGEEEQQLPSPGEEARDVLEAKRTRMASRWGLVMSLVGRSVGAFVLLSCVVVLCVMRGAFPSALNEEEMS